MNRGRRRRGESVVLAERLRKGHSHRRSSFSTTAGSDEGKHPSRSLVEQIKVEPDRTRREVLLAEGLPGCDTLTPPSCATVATFQFLQCWTSRTPPQPASHPFRSADLLRGMEFGPSPPLGSYFGVTEVCGGARRSHPPFRCGRRVSLLLMAACPPVRSMPAASCVPTSRARSSGCACSATARPSTSTPPRPGRRTSLRRFPDEDPNGQCSAPSLAAAHGVPSGRFMHRADFSYELPPGLIAQAPRRSDTRAHAVREGQRRDGRSHDRDLTQAEAPTLLVFNDTRWWQRAVGASLRADGSRSSRARRWAGCRVQMRAAKQPSGPCVSPLAANCASSTGEQSQGTVDRSRRGRPAGLLRGDGAVRCALNHTRRGARPASGPSISRGPGCCAHQQTACTREGLIARIDAWAAPRRSR